MLELLSRDGLFPFLVGSALVVGFLLVEVMLTLVGLSSGGHSDAGGLHAEVGAGHEIADLSISEIAAELHVGTEIAAHIEAEIAAHPGIGPDGHGGGHPGGTAGGGINAAQDGGAGSQAASGPNAIVGLFDFLGIRKLPLTVWLALFSASFAASGLAFQVAMNALLGFMLLPLPASIIALVPAVSLTRGLAGLIAAWLPRDESYVISERSLGRRRGTVTVGTAKRGHPAEVRIKDRYGNTHYTMIEPLSDGDEISAGAEVLVLRLPGGALRMLQIH
ncbi:MAG: DUF1449 family protein [Rhodobacteraceae bacterium]|nr:DUF1449 family protein [Paracoccaceae bacterium]